MAVRPRDRIRFESPRDWTVTPISAQARVRRAAAPPAFPAAFLSKGRVELHQAYSATGRARRGVTPPELRLSVQPTADETYLVAVRHSSGALTFYRADELVQRRVARRTTTELRFRLSVPVAAGPARRGLLSAPIKVIVLKVLGKLADAALPVLARALEKRLWAQRHLQEGWVRCLEADLTSNQLPAAQLDALPAPPQRSLLFLHGTFSHALSAFHDLASTHDAADRGFFSQVQDLYGDRIYAFNHFTVSKTPEENVRDLLSSLPTRPALFDVITHSRGGLVLRTLVERRAAFGTLADRFQLGSAVLVAAPNEGTPLATASRWEVSVGWLANLLEVFPENPFTFGAELVSDGLVWIARRATGALPGLAAMAVGGETIQELQGPPGPPTRAYSALAANYTPDAALWQRMLDAGVDTFFGSANDLVVPAEGAWHVDHDATPAIPGEQIGCFGAGGNLARDGVDVHHLNFFSQPETVTFLVTALKGSQQPLRPQDPDGILPSRSVRTRRGLGSSATAAVPPGAAPPAAAPPPPTIATTLPMVSAGASAHDTLHLILLDPPESGELAQLLATYGSARAVETIQRKGGEAGQRWRKIIQVHESILKYLDGDDGGQLPDDQQLVGYGTVLFETLFYGKVRRLYDVARSLQGSRRLDVVFTSMIDWVTDKPWEFVFDPSRKTFLATEEVNFVRNVLTSIPAEPIPVRDGPLRIMVAVAQPIGTGALSADEEIEVIRRGFLPLIDAGLATVEVVSAVTPRALHAHVASKPFDILHFIGHGFYDPTTRRGYLLFDDGQGSAQKVDDRSLREILCQRGIRLIFLNACETGRGGRADFNRGVAPALVAGGCPSVVANQYKVLDPSATAFARHFYWSLAQGRSFGEAAREARIAVNYSIAGESIDWAVPVVYARDPSAVLCRPSPGAAVSSIASPVTRTRRGTIDRPVRVAVWDVNHLFPRLEQTLARMTTVQTRFGFQVVDITAPLGTWRLQRRGKDEDVSGVLHAVHVAERLKNKPRELGVNYLFCITGFRLGDDEYDDLYGWDSDKYGIGLFSTAGFDLAAAGPQAVDRAVANCAVASLVSMRADVGSHQRAPKTCPLYFNDERDIAHIIAQQHFDPRCRRQIADRIPEDLPALEQVLNAFV